MDEILNRAKELLNKAVNDKKIKSFSLTNYEMKNGMKLRNPDIGDFLITSNLVVDGNDGTRSMQPFFLARGDSKKEVEQNYIKAVENELKRYYK